MTRKEFFPEVEKYFKENPADFEDLIENWLEDIGLYEDIWHSIDDFDDMMYEMSPLDIIGAIDMDNFNSCESYFKETIYGYITSDEKDYSNFFNEYDILEMAKHAAKYYFWNATEETKEILTKFLECEER